MGFCAFGIFHVTTDVTSFVTDEVLSTLPDPAPDTPTTVPDRNDPPTAIWPAIEIGVGVALLALGFVLAIRLS